MPQAIRIYMIRFCISAKREPMRSLSFLRFVYYFLNLASNG